RGGSHLGEAVNPVRTSTAKSSRGDSMRRREKRDSGGSETSAAVIIESEAELYRLTKPFVRRIRPNVQMSRYLVLCLVFTGCFSGYSTDEAERELRVRRGAFKSELVLSGELESARGDALAVPPLPSWQTAIKWLADDGAHVNAGDPVA